MKVLIVDDSALVRSILAQVLKRESQIDLVGEAKNGVTAIEQNKLLNPDLIIMDIDMPIMNGLDAIKIIMQNNPVPIVVLSSMKDSLSSYTAQKNGALGFIEKPELSKFNNPDYYKSFIQELYKISKIKVKKKTQNRIEHSNNKFLILTIGASTGGPLAIVELLGDLPKDFPLGMVLVQHLESGYEKTYANWLNEESHFNVRVAKNGDWPKPGEVLIAPTDIHLIFDGQKLIYNDGPKILNQKPSVDALFQSAARFLGKNVLAVLLTGMGKDGGQGCFAIKEKGGFTLVQDEKSCTIFGMPKTAIELNGASDVVPLSKIGEKIIKILNQG